MTLMVRAQTKGKVERMNGYLRRSFYVPLLAQMRAAGLELDIATANTQVWRWLREVANVREHGTTKEAPQARLARELPALQPVPPTYASQRTVLQPKAADELRRLFGDWLAPLQHPLSVYEHLMQVPA